jgi:predicted acyltransferase
MLITQKIDHRNLVLDVIRGMAVLGLLLVKFPGNPNYVYRFLHYSEGVMFTDVVYSFFLFTVGASMFYSFSKYEFSWSKRVAVRICKRVVALFAIGVALNLLDMINTRTPHFVIMGDLQYIAVAYGLTAVLILWLKRLRFLIAVALLLTITCYLIFSLQPLPVDVLRILSYMIIILTGYVTITLCHGRTSRLLLSLGLFIVGLSCFLVSRVWEYTVPLDTTFVVKLMSYPWITYAGLVFLIDVCKWTSWTSPFTIFGKNALFIFILSAVFAVLFGKIIVWMTPAGSTISVSQWFYKNVCVALFGNNLEAGSLCYALVGALLMWLLAWLFYRWKIFIKV